MLPLGCAIVQLPELGLFIYQYARKMLSYKPSFQANESTNGEAHFTEESVRSNRLFTVIPHKKRSSSEETKDLMLLNKKIDNIETYLARIGTLGPGLVYQRLVEMESKIDPTFKSTQYCK